MPDKDLHKNNLQQILDEASSLPEYSTVHIKLKKGLYKGQFFFDGNRSFPGKRGVSVIVEGCGIGKTVISGSLAASEILDDGIKRGTFRTYTAYFSGPRVELRKLTIENTAGLPPPEGIGRKAMQGIALYAAGETTICRKVELLGHQDTLFLAPLPAAEREKGGFRGPGEFAPRMPTLQLYEKCVVSGTVDFVFGGAASLFRKCKFIVRNGGRGAELPLDEEPLKNREVFYVAAPCSDAPAAENDSSSGFFFKDCVFSVESCSEPVLKKRRKRGSEAAQNDRLQGGACFGEAARNDGAVSAAVYLARPWRPYGRCFFFDCRIKDGFSSELWHVWNSDNDKKTAGFYLCGGNKASGKSSAEDWGPALTLTEKRLLLSKLETMLH